MSGNNTRTHTPLNDEGLRPGDADRIIADVTTRSTMCQSRIVDGHVHMSIACMTDMVSEIIARKQEMRVMRAKEVEEGSD